MASPILSNKVVRATLLAIPVFLALSLSYFRVFELYELQTYDWRCQLRIPRPMSDDIVFIHVGEDTLQRLGQWPISRDYHAALIHVLGQAGAKAVLFDMVFTESRPEEDALVAQEARAAKNVYFALAFSEPQWRKGLFFSTEYLSTLIPAYEKAAKGVGFVNVKADMDGKRRRVPLIISHNTKNNYYIALQVAMDVLGINKEKVSTASKNFIALSDDLKIPLDEEGYFLVSFAERWGINLFKHYSYYDILQSYSQISDHQKSVVDLKKLAGKICLVGYTGTAMGDTNATPLERISPNVAIHANALNNILQKDFIRRVNRFVNLLILMILASWMVTLSLKFRPLVAFRATILTLMLYTTLAMCVFLQWGIWMDLFYPLTLSIVIYALATLSRTLYEVKKRELIEGELKIASQIQKSFLPPTVPEHPGLELAVYMKPAKAVGGDLYAFIPLGDKKIGVMLGDVSGKGTPAALFMAKAVSEFKFSARENTDPAEVLMKFNHSIASESTGGLFVTLVYVILDTGNKKLWLSNAGHLPVICVRPDGQASPLSVDGGMPIGVMDGVPFMRFEKEIHEGEYYALYSDGVSEARNKKKEEFGIETLQQLMQDHQGRSAQRLLNHVIERLNQFMGKADQHDDITLLIAKIDSNHGSR